MGPKGSFCFSITLRSQPTLPARAYFCAPSTLPPPSTTNHRTNTLFLFAQCRPQLLVPRRRPNAPSATRSSPPAPRRPRPVMPLLSPSGLTAQPRRVACRRAAHNLHPPPPRGRGLTSRRLPIAATPPAPYRSPSPPALPQVRPATARR